MPEGENALRYQLSVHGRHLDAGQVRWKDNEIAIDSAIDDGAVHTVRVIGIVSDIVRYEYRYMVMADCRISLDRRIYKAGADDVNAVFSYRETETSVTLSLPYGICCINFFTPEFGDIQFEVEVTAVNCSFRGAFSAPDFVWHKDIANGETVQIVVPKNYSARQWNVLRRRSE